jgi:hypothetical protein
MKDKKEEAPKKIIKGYSISVSPVDTLLWQRLDLMIELDENRVPKIVGHSWGNHDDKNMVIQSIENEIALDVVKGLYR